MTYVLEHLAADYPQLYLNPDIDSQEAYRNVVLRGAAPEHKSLAHYRGDAADREETVNTPAGSVRVVTLGNRQDFELVMRGLMAAKDGPKTEVPMSQGASTLALFNWPRIHAHLEKFPAEEQAAAFKRFTAVKENYIDHLVVLSRGPYSGVAAEAAGLLMAAPGLSADAAGLSAADGYGEKEWLDISDTIRRYHELTHVVCRRLYPGDIEPIRDELVADAVGIYAAYGHFDPAMEMLFLGLSDGVYTGGRLGNYTDRPGEIAGPVCQALGRIKAVVDSRRGAAPFDLIEELMRVIGDVSL